MRIINNPASRNVVFFLALATLLTACTPPGPRALLQGKRLLDRGDYPKAVEKLSKAASLLQTNAAAWNYLGMAYHHAGDPSNAVKAYQQALHFDHDLSEAHYNLGCLWLEQGRFDAARSELTAYTLRRGTAVEGWIKLGSAQLQSRQPADAEKSFREALRFSPKSPEALNGLGLAAIQRNRPSDALQFFRAALQHTPNHAPALLNLGVVLHVHLNDRARAWQAYRDYLALSPRPADWERVKATMQELEAPQRIASRAPAPAPVNPVPSPATRTATKPAQPALPARSEPTVTPPRTTVGPAASQRVESVALAADTARPASNSPAPAPAEAQPREVPDRVDARTAPGPAESSAVPAAIAARFPRYRYRSPGKPVAGDHAAAERAFRQGVQAHQAGRFQEAMQAYRQATELDPAYFDAYYNLGLAATSARNLNQALIAYETALAIRPQSLDARYNFALLLTQSNHVLDAVKELEELLVSYPRDGRSHLALGNLYAQQLAQPGRAREHYVKMLETDPHNSQAPRVRYWLAANPL